MSGGDVQTFWDEQAATFDDEPDHGLADPVTRKAWEDLLDRALGGTQGTVVDLGCGTGTLSRLLARRGHRVFGVDLSPKMIERAEDRARSEGLEIDFLVGDVRTAAIPPLTYGAVVCRHVLWAVPEPAELVARWSEALADDGVFIAIEGLWNQAGLRPEEIFAVLQTHFEQVAYTDLSPQSILWGKDVTDHRYLVVARQPRAAGTAPPPTTGDAGRVERGDAH